MERKGVWTPKEIKQKEVVWFHLLGNPITSRHLIFLGMGSILGFLFFFISYKYKPIEFNTYKGIQDLIQRVSISIGFMMLGVIFSSPDKKTGKYQEERILSKIKYKKQSKIIFNSKTANVIMKQEVGGKDNGSKLNKKLFRKEKQ